jgi:hypothetical protein
MFIKICVGSIFMYKIIKNKLASLLVLPFLLFSLVGQGAVSSLVLCIGDDDHVAIELNDSCSNEAVVKPCKTDGELFAFHDPDHGNADCPCLNIPLLIGSSHPNISSSHYFSILKNMIRMEYATLRDMISTLQVTGFHSPIPQFPAFSLTQLRTTVLLT